MVMLMNIGFPKYVLDWEVIYRDPACAGRMGWCLRDADHQQSIRFTYEIYRLGHA